MSNRSAHSTHGVTWDRSSNFARKLQSALVALTVAIGIVAVPSIAAAGKPSKGDVVQDREITTTLPNLFGTTGAEYANELGYTGDGIDIAVIDTGINIVPGLDSRGKVIDGVDLSFDSGFDNLIYRDYHGHGTNMAGIIAAVPSRRSSGLAMGMAPGARLVNVKVGAANGAVDVSQVIAGIDWVIANKNADGMNIRVINLAYGTDALTNHQTDPLSHAVENAWNNGIVVVVAAGNEGRSERRLGNPAINPFVIAVGASQDSTKIPEWASTGDGTRNPDFVVPGVGVVSLRVPGSYLDTHYPEARWTSGTETYLRGSGTSQAAAVVSGLTAVLLEAHPEYTPDDVKALFKATASPIRNINATIQGSGVANLEAALQYSGNLGDTSQPFEPSTGTGSIEAARGSIHVSSGGETLQGEFTAFGTIWDAETWAADSAAGTAWSGGTWSGGTWSGGTWSGGTWSGGTWSGGTWSGGTWSGGTWSGGTWSGGTWSGGTWSGGTWSGGTWSGSGWL